MVVQEVGEMVRHKVLTRHSQVHRVPVEKLAAEKTGNRRVLGEARGRRKIGK